jgi:sialate O-acetylesterase
MSPVPVLQNVYEPELYWGSPKFETVTFENNTATLQFSNTGTGLMTRDKFGYIRGFHIAGKEQKFYWAQAQLKGNSVIVYSDKVTEPQSVRYAWADNPGKLDLYSKEGWPVLPFRTDDWTLSTAGQKYNHTPHQF